MKSPIVRIELTSPGSQSVANNSNTRQIKARPSGSGDSGDEHIANMPELVNDSMVGDLN